MYQQTFPPHIVCAYLYIISQHGYPPPAEDSFKHIKDMHELGFQSIELEGIRENHLLEMYHLREDLSRTIQELQMHVPFFCVVLPGLSSPEPQIREHNLVLFEKGCETAQRLGARGVLDNAPLPPYVFPSEIPLARHYEPEVLQHAHLPKDLSWKKYWKSLTRTYRTACDIASNYGLTYHMHPCAGVLAANTDAFLYFYDAVGKENLKFNLDTSNQFFLQDNIYLSLIRLSDHIDYIHISDNPGNKVAHLVPGEGIIHWDLFFEKLREISFNGYLGLDIGGEESPVAEIQQSYQQAAQWLIDKYAPFLTLD